MHNKIKRYLIFAAGILFLLLGLFGMLLPVLPTTPFLLVASFAFMNSSKRMHHWLMNHPIFGEYITNYIKHKAIKKSDLIKSLIAVWLGIGLAIFLQKTLWVRMILFVIAVLVSKYLSGLKLIDSREE